MDLVRIPALVIAAVFASPLVVAPGLMLWDAFRPYLIPHAEIDSLALACMKQFHARAVREIEMLEDRAGHGGAFAQRDVLRRIRHAVLRMEAAADGTAGQVIALARVRSDRQRTEGSITSGQLGEYARQLGDGPPPERLR